MHCNQTLIPMRLPLHQERLDIKNFVLLDFCFGFSSCFFKYLSTLLTWDINRIEAPPSGLLRSYRSALFRPVTVHLVLFITSSVHPHPSSFLCMLCSLLHSLFLNFLKESREFVVKVCGGERTACAVTFIQCGCYWSLKCCEWKCGRKDKEDGRRNDANSIWILDLMPFEQHGKNVLQKKICIFL